jgi:hypothetical protein
LYAKLFHGAHWDQGVFLSAAAAGDFLLPRARSKVKRSTLNLPSAAGAVSVANYTRRVANECRRAECFLKQEIRADYSTLRDDRSAIVVEQNAVTHT